MSIIEAILLGLVQGLTEFLPVSSSGHLVLLQSFMGLADTNFAFTLMLHLGTFLAVVIAYFDSVKNMIIEFFKMLFDLITFKGPHLEKSKYRKYIIYIIIGSIPAGIVGVLFDDYFEAIFANVTVVAFTLLITGGILIGAEYLMQRGKNKKEIENLGYWNALSVGVFQMCAIMPGVSRSGSTIFAGLLSGLKREDAVEFAFLLSLPASLGSLLLNLNDVAHMTQAISWLPVGIGFFVSMVVGYFSIRLLNAMVKKGSLVPFAIYCFAIGVIVILNLTLFTR